MGEHVKQAPPENQPARRLARSTNRPDLTSWPSRGHHK